MRTVPLRPEEREDPLDETEPELLAPDEELLPPLMIPREEFPDDEAPPPWMYL